MKMIMNELWDSLTHPYVSIITPIYNRANVIDRAFQSVERQTYRNFEYIIVDDGSIDNIDEIVMSFLAKISFPAMYIKKENGGVHTARNIAVAHARGELCCFLDSDDEFTNNGVQILVNTWNNIPVNIIEEYFEVKARCYDEKGKKIGAPFPDNMNNFPWVEAKRIYEENGAEHCGIRNTRILRENPWPEADGVTFVGENILWHQLREKYKTWVTNECVQIYHTEGDDHIAPNLNRKKKNFQQCKNSFWNISFQLNDFELFGKGRSRIRAVFSREVYGCILSINGQEKPSITLKGLHNRVLAFLLYIPAIFASLFYINRIKR